LTDQFGPNIADPKLRLPFIQVHLENRKGWQNKQGWDSPLNSMTLLFDFGSCKLIYDNLGNTYHIYEQNVYAMDMFTHLLRWITVLENQLGRALEPGDYLFPYISPNGMIDAKQSMTHDIVQQLLCEFTQGAGLKKYFTTHALRRGGAQYQLMYAPIGWRWSLMRSWWGGWAEGEDVRQCIC
jgi:hypothetical protein